MIPDCRGPHPDAEREDRLPELADALDGMMVVTDATFVPDDPGGPTVEIAIEPWAEGLPPIVVEVASNFDARIRRFEKRGENLPYLALAR